MKEKGTALFVWKTEIIVNKPMKEVAYTFPRLFHNHNSNSALSHEIWYYMKDTPHPENETEYIIQVFPTPPAFFQARDVVLNSTVHNIDENRIAFVEDASSLIPHSTGFIRCQTFLGGFLFTALSPSSTSVTVIFDLDPKGMVPKWVLNLAGADTYKAALKFKDILEKGTSLGKYPINYQLLKRNSIS